MAFVLHEAPFYFIYIFCLPLSRFKRGGIRTGDAGWMAGLFGGVRCWRSTSVNCAQFTAFSFFFFFYNVVYPPPRKKNEKKEPVYQKL